MHPGRGAFRHGNEAESNTPWRIEERRHGHIWPDVNPRHANFFSQAFSLHSQTASCTGGRGWRTTIWVRNLLCKNLQRTALQCQKNKLGWAVNSLPFYPEKSLCSAVFNISLITSHIWLLAGNFIGFFPTWIFHKFSRTKFSFHISSAWELLYFCC